MANGGAAMTLRITAAGIVDAQEALRSGHPALTKAFRLIGNEILDFWARKFDEQNFSDLEKETKRRKAKAGYSVYPILVATRQIRNVLDKSNKNAPGRTFVITRKSVTVGYGGNANYQPGDSRYAKAFGRIADLAQLHADGRYGAKGNPAPRELTPEIPQSLYPLFQAYINRAIQDIIEGQA